MKHSAPSHMHHQFSQVPKATIPRAKFNRSFGRKMTFNAGDLIPCFLDEVLPGDTFNCRMTAFARLATPIYPIMDNIFLESFFFFVPMRLVWQHWENFNGAQDNPGDSTSYVLPTMTIPAGGVVNGTLPDYMGVPAGIAGTAGQTINSLPFRAYNLIWNDWFRDENLKNSAPFSALSDGPDTYGSFSVVRKRGKRHDYFTSCLPWPQKGTAVALPLGGNAPVVLNGTLNQYQLLKDADDHALHTTNAALGSAATTGRLFVQGGSDPADTLVLDPNGTLSADLSAVTAATINQLRQSFQIQKLYERDARGGTRYTEIIRSHFGVESPDARLQRPEYLGGGSSRINISAVPQTSATGASGTTTPIGTLSAFGTGAMQHGFTKSFVEHGYVIGLVNVRADITYQYGLPKLFSRSTRWDFYWPALAHIGEQAVLNKEIYWQGTSDDANVFGYQERFAEYRYKPSEVCGQFRSNYATPLDAWHLADKYTSLPVLGSTWIDDQPPMARVKAVTTAPDILFDGYFDLVCARPMPVYGVPGLIDHF